MPSLICVVFTREKSTFFCQDWRKMLRCPPPEIKLVSNVSPGGIAEQGMLPSRACALAAALHGYSSGTVKHEAFNAGKAKLLPIAPVTAFLAVQPGASGTIGLVIPSLML